MLVILFRLISFIGIVASIAWAIKATNERYDSSSDSEKKKSYIGPIILFAVSLIVFIFSLSAVYISGTQRGVVENTATGKFSVIGPGFHIYPMQTDLVPFLSRVTTYDMRQQRIEIGKPTGEGDTASRPTVAAASNSPGNPVVYIEAAGWVSPNPAALVELHRRYGPDYADKWVENQWVTSLKGVQGTKPYNYIGGNRDSLALEAEDALQAQLMDGEVPLVEVSQTAIVNYDYEQRINDQLAQVSQREFENQQAQGAVEIARTEQEKQNIEADTRIQIAQKDAESRVIQAQGEADAIRTQQEALAAAQNDAAYLMLKWIERWNGEVPVYDASGTEQGPVPFLNIPQEVAPAGE